MDDDFLNVLSAAGLDAKTPKVITYNSKSLIVLPYVHAQESEAHDDFMWSYNINKEISGMIAPHIYGQFTASDLEARRVDPEVHYLVIEAVTSFGKFMNTTLEGKTSAAEQSAVDWLAGCLWDMLSSYVLKTNNFPTELNKAHLHVSKGETPVLYYLGGWISIDDFDPQRVSLLLRTRNNFVEATRIMENETPEDKEARKALFLYPKNK